ncbi:hypothetical protein AVEN_143088-1 [Araneus ventricosus]|uniref:Helitron helicase-like domain-containing protein n=1 Tax=Araneus ventricosus TaxID=182803 RepID=A0A4Y2I7F5_ARAVE|nr:hypothetical protein AVEN_143088-1 [Araneus ventricosus]
MAMVRKFSKPDLFLTFTCNPSWIEILNCMEGVERPEDRSDNVRVFNIKLKELLEDICKYGIFGTVLAYIYVIEFQKRGLPHAHVFLTLDSESKIRTKDDIDKFVSAELPDPCTDLRLFQIVTKCMVHGPCGTININSTCMRDGQCYKSFPKQFKDDTEENVNGYPIYRRRATEPVQVGKYSIDNRWVNLKGILVLGFWTLERKKRGSTIQLPLQCYPSIQDPIQQLYSDRLFQCDLTGT